MINRDLEYGFRVEMQRIRALPFAQRTGTVQLGVGHPPIALEDAAIDAALAEADQFAARIRAQPTDGPFDGAVDAEGASPILHAYKPAIRSLFVTASTTRTRIALLRLAIAAQRAGGLPTADQARAAGLDGFGAEQTATGLVLTAREPVGGTEVRLPPATSGPARTPQPAQATPIATDGF
jgi:hypothetical protein